MYHLDANSNFEFMNWGLQTDPLHKCAAEALSKCFCPSLYVGVDLNALQVASATKRSGSSGPCPLSFVQGDAENLPFPDASFDIVVNVESSHTYPHFDRFVAEVRRVLRPNGRFV